MRSLSELEKNAAKFWPEELKKAEENVSIIPKLIETQEKFLSILNLIGDHPFEWETLVNSTSALTPNLFLKHLIVITDVGGEKLMRFKKNLKEILYPDNEAQFYWNGELYSYHFLSLESKKNWDNKNLGVDGDNLHSEIEFDDLLRDVANLLIFGGSFIQEDIPNEITDKCIIGSLLGEEDKLENFVKQRYIWVSRITGGAASNKMGYLLQHYVENYLINNLPEWEINQESLPNVSTNDRTSLKVDIIAKSPNDNYCAIEVSFQVTTNSVIERKAGQAKDRYYMLHDAGHKIAYIIDGIGNFERSSAIRTIAEFSDCIVNFNELNMLVNYLKGLEK